MDKRRREDITDLLRRRPRRWVVTGAAGFIGSSLVQGLLRLGQEVTGLDNFSSGYRANIEAAVAAGETRNIGGGAAADRFRLIEGDIRNSGDCAEALHGADYVLHHAALGSVPASIDDPVFANANNVDGFLAMLTAARDAGVRRFVYATSSAVYGDGSGDMDGQAATATGEDVSGPMLSPYAATKLVNELYAQVFARCYGMESVGLRYFNVFGPRQDPDGGYAAVIPKWFDILEQGGVPVINGDGMTIRDFCFIEDVVEANILAALVPLQAEAPVYNIGTGTGTSLLKLFRTMRRVSAERVPAACEIEPEFGPFRQGDIRHSVADIGKARKELGFSPRYSLEEGLRRTAAHYLGGHPQPRSGFPPLLFSEENAGAVSSESWAAGSDSG